MARPTRSSTQDSAQDLPPSPRKPSSKKRKRTSIADANDAPNSKLPRTDDAIKEEGSVDPEDSLLPDTTQPDLPSSGDVPIDPSDAQKILDILEIVDTQGLLDRVFPLPADSAAGPSTSTKSYSFRALLKEPNLHPLRVLRSAVQHLLPISSHPRSRPSAPAAEQLRFCNLALSLLDQASFRSSPIPLNVESVLSAYNAEASGPSGSADDVKPSQGPSERKRKYALVQRLPTGDWWSSTNSSLPLDGKELKDLPTAYSELVAIFPSPSSSTTNTLGTLNLEAYATKKAGKAPYYAPEPLPVTCGKFLDYGPYASFAPSFDQEGVEIGRVALGEVIFQQERKRRLRARTAAASKRVARAVEPTQALIQQADEPPGLDVAEAVQTDLKQKQRASRLDVDGLNDLLSSEQIAALKSALGSLELEAAVAELLERNARALQRLEELQLERLGGGASIVEVGSEEWDIAQGILDSLTVLASLRPRRSGDDSEHPPLVPSASALRKLHRTLPLGTSGGWYGTLPADHTTALRDDTTLHVRSGAVAAAVQASPAPVTATLTAPATPAPKSATATTPYSSYYSSGYNAGQYRGGYGTYSTPTQTGAHYSSYTASQPQTSSYYPNTQYSTTGQHQYSSYSSSWYNYQPPANTTTAATATTSSGRATPQPTTTSTNYSTFYASTQQPQPQRAVANTVLSTKSYQQPNTWANGQSNYAPPTLPPHLRPATASTPGTPQPGASTQASGYQSYYNYQATPTR